MKVTLPASSGAATANCPGCIKCLQALGATPNKFTCGSNNTYKLAVKAVGGKDSSTLGQFVVTPACVGANTDKCAAWKA